MKIISIMFKGGWVMLPIILCSVFAFAIIIERFIFYRVIQRINNKKIFEKIFELVEKNKISEAIEICNKNPFYLTNIIKTALLHYEDSNEMIKDSIETTALYEIPTLEKNLHFLSTIAHISPLLGLLGTVTGLVRCFYIIEKKASSFGVVNPSDLAGGIWEALITTVAGLCIAIPAYIAYNYFVNKVNILTLEAERVSLELLEIVSRKKYEDKI